MRRRGGEEPRIIRITTDHAIERDHVRRRQDGSYRREVPKLKLHSPVVSQPLGLLSRSGEVRLRGIQVDRVAEAALQEDVMNGADASTNVEQCRRRGERAGLDGRQQVSGGSIRPAPAEPAEISPSDGGIKLLIGSTTVAASH